MSNNVSDFPAEISEKPPKTKKGKRILALRQPQVHEPSKRSLFLRGSKASMHVQRLLQELDAIRKPESVYLSSRGQLDFHPLENAESAEYLCRKNDCSLFCYGSSNKKRPFSLVFGRLFEDAVLDMYEFEVENYRPRNEFPGVTANALGSKPLVVFQGPGFEASEEYRSVKNLLGDFFSGPKASKVCLQGIDHAIVITAAEKTEDTVPAMRLRHYRLDYLKADGPMPRVEIREVGPSFNLRLGRCRQPDPERLKLSLKVPREVAAVKTKNVTTNVLGEKRGRVFMEPQDFTKLHTPHHHGASSAKRPKVARSFSSKKNS